MDPGHKGRDDAHPRQNLLLNALADDAYARLEPQLELRFLPLGDVVIDAGEPPRYAYFPTTAVVSLLTVLENGASAEMAVCGRDGLIGVSLYMGGVTTITRAVVQSAGHAYRLPAPVLLAEFGRGGAVNRLLLRYVQALVTQMVQTAACNRHHSIEQQLCRWLLLSLDLLPTNELIMTQDLIADMLGVRRAGITKAARHLQSDQTISYNRGHIVVLDRRKLEQCSCECYKVVKEEVRRLMPG